MAIKDISSSSKKAKLEKKRGCQDYGSAESSERIRRKAEARPPLERDRQSLPVTAPEPSRRCAAPPTRAGSTSYRTKKALPPSARPRSGRRVVLEAPDFLRELRREVRHLPELRFCFL